MALSEMAKFWPPKLKIVDDFDFYSGLQSKFMTVQILAFLHIFD